MKLYMVVAPLAVVAVLQASGCSSSSGAPQPGATYLSTSAGAHFDQSVSRSDTPEENIGSYVLRGAHRPTYATNEVYVAASNRGVVFSENGGESWQVWTTPLTAVSDVVALSNGVVIAGGTDTEGQGFVLRTADQGKSWETVLTIPSPVKQNQGLIKSSSGNSQSVVISITPDPFVADRLYAGTSLGNILIGEQSGKTWRTADTVSTGTIVSSRSRQKFAIRDVVASPHVQGELLLITADGALFRIADNGSAEPEELEISDDLTREGSRLSRTRAKEILSATYVQQFPEALFVGVDDGAVISRDRGATWQQLPLPVDAVADFNSSTVTVSPTNPNRLFVGINGVVYRSEDGGVSWNTFSLGLKNHAITSLLIDAANASNVVAVTTPLGS